MKKVVMVLLSLLLCGSLFACAEAQSAQDAFVSSPEGSMIGKTFQEVEAAFGPFSMVFFEEDRPAAYVFAKTNVSFHFDAPQTEAGWKGQLVGGLGYLPGAIALRDIRPTDVCSGVSGRIRDFGIDEGTVSTLSTYLQSLHLASTETKANTVYTLTTGDQAYDVYLYCAHGETAFTPDHQVRVMVAGQTLAPVPDPSVTEFTFGGAIIQVGATEVEVRGTSNAYKAITFKEFTDLVTYCPHLKTLILDYCHVTGEEQVGQLTELTHLEIMSCGIPDISFVRSLTRLTRLGVCHNHIADVSPIEELPLTYLNIADNPDLGNRALTSVGEVTTLENLYIYSLDISNLSALKPLKHLAILNVNNDSRLDEEDLSTLKHLSALRKLQINGTAVTDFDFLFNYFPKMKELEARKLNNLADPNLSYFQLAQHPGLNKVTLSKAAQDSLDAEAMAAYGMSATDWFKAQGITLLFK